MAVISLSRILQHWSERKPAAPAVTHAGASRSWAELEAGSNQLARAYARLGVGQDDYVALALPNGIEFVAAVFAVWKLGAIPLPMSPRLTDFERLQMLQLARPKLLLGAPPGDSGVAALPQGFTPAADESTAALPERTARSMKAMTSGGSTGRPKLIVSLRPAVWDAAVKPPGFCDQGTVLVPGPLYHQGPFSWGFVGMFQGSHLVLTTRFDAEETLALVERHRVDTTCVVPTMMLRIWKLPAEVRARYDVSSLRNFWHLGAPCAPWLKRAFIDWLGPTAVWELYGGTESLGTTTIRGDEWLAHPGSVGRPADTCEMKIVGQSGETLPPGATGEIYIRPRSGAGTTYRYIGAEARSLGDGWESLGDIGYFDADGYLYIKDRLTDMILCGGANIYPAEIEAAIDACPGVRSSAVIGLPDEDLGNRVHAIVDAPGAALTAEALLSHLSQVLARPKLPRSFEFVDYPLRDDSGKVRRAALRAERL